MKRNDKIEVGMVFGRLTVVEAYVSKNSGGHSKHRCLCICGNKVDALRGNLLIGDTASCGCLRVETTSESFKKHGKSKSDIYTVWINMKNRCYTITCDRYPQYGARGIEVCNEWKESFEKFYSDMGDLPFKGAQIDRIDVNGNYCKENCRWVTNKENARNKQTTVILTYLGISASLSDWCEALEISSNAVHARLKKLNWSVEKTLTTRIGETYGD